MGGDLIIGMDEANGIPTGIPGVSVANVDAEKLRLDEIIRRGIEPRIDFAIHTIDTGTGTTVFIIWESDNVWLTAVMVGEIVKYEWKLADLRSE